MNCHEAQSHILHYIHHQLNKEETKAFIEHVRTCPDCRDELEINYIILVGMRQLDEGGLGATDFRKDLEEDLDWRYKEIVNEKYRRHAVRVSIIAFVIFFFSWMLSIMLNLIL